MEDKKSDTHNNITRRKASALIGTSIAGPGLFSDRVVGSSAGHQPGDQATTSHNQDSPLLTTNNTRFTARSGSLFRRVWGLNYNTDYLIDEDGSGLINRHPKYDADRLINGIEPIELPISPTNVLAMDDPEEVPGVDREPAVEELMSHVVFKRFLIGLIEDAADEDEQAMEGPTEDLLEAGIDLVAPGPISPSEFIEGGEFVGIEELLTDGNIANASLSAINATDQLERFGRAVGAIDIVLGTVNLVQEAFEFGRAFADVAADAVRPSADMDDVVKGTVIPMAERNIPDNPADVKELKELLNAEQKVVLPLLDHALATENSELLEMVAVHYDRLLDAQRSAFAELLWLIRRVEAPEGNFAPDELVRLRPEAICTDEQVIDRVYDFDDFDEIDIDGVLEPAIDETEMSARDLLTESAANTTAADFQDPHLYGGPTMHAQMTRAKYDGFYHSDYFEERLDSSENVSITFLDNMNDDEGYDDFEMAELGVPTHALRPPADLGLDAEFECEDGGPAVEWSSLPHWDGETEPVLAPYQDLSNEYHDLEVKDDHFGVSIETPVGYLMQAAGDVLECEGGGILSDPRPPEAFRRAQKATQYMFLLDMLSTDVVAQQALIHTTAPLYGTRSAVLHSEQAEEPPEAAVNNVIIDRVQDIRGPLEDGDVIVRGDEITVETRVEHTGISGPVEVEFFLNENDCGDMDGFREFLGSEEVTVAAEEHTATVEWSGPVDTEFSGENAQICATVATEEDDPVVQEVVSVEFAEGDTVEVDTNDDQTGVDSEGIVDKFGPGFGVPVTVTACATAGYLLKHRLTNNDPE